MTRSVVPRVFKMTAADRERIRSLKREGEGNFDMLMRIAETVRTLEVEEAEWVNYRLELPVELYEALDEKSGETGLHRVRLLLMAVDALHEKQIRKDASQGKSKRK